ncbi:MAG: hypothetical protein HRT89_22760 [Lentisphaeria bacterium]|nr:hypothetical protein [Lentisphaeria bacterium]NQZ70882.1 hypothetical protein [Lentisphaeria bacterium]
MAMINLLERLLTPQVQATILTDMEMNVMHMNLNAQEMTGYECITFDEGESWKYPEQIQLELIVMDCVAPGILEAAVKDRFGEYIEVFVTISPYFNDNNEHCGYQVKMTDSPELLCASLN